MKIAQQHAYEPVQSNDDESAETATTSFETKATGWGKTRIVLALVGVLTLLSLGLRGDLAGLFNFVGDDGENEPAALTSKAGEHDSLGNLRASQPVATEEAEDGADGMVALEDDDIDEQQSEYSEEEDDTTDSMDLEANSSHADASDDPEPVSSEDVDAKQSDSPVESVEEKVLKDTSTPSTSPITSKPNLVARFNHSNGYAEDWLLAKEKAGWMDYPISDEQFNLTYHPRKVSNCGFRRLRDRLDAGEHITIGVFGDSVTWGASCVSPTWGSTEQCPWPRRLQAWFRVQYPHWNITIQNFAIRSFYPEDFFNIPEEIDVADAYILAFIFVDPVGTKRFLRALKGPKLAIGLARGCSADLAHCKKYCGNWEPDPIISLSMGNRSRVPGGEGTTLTTLTDPAYTCKGYWDGQKYFEMAVESENVSMASYRDIYWPNRERMNPDFGFYWNGLAHPDTVGQDFISHVVEYGLWREFQYEGPSCDIVPQEPRPCSTGLLSVVDPRQKEQSMKPAMVNGWGLFEDRDTKLGWIAQTYSNTSVLAFDMIIAKTLNVVYLGTYEKIAPVYMRLEGCAEEIKLDPLWELQASKPKSEKFTGVQGLPEHTYLPCLPPGNATKVRISFRAPTGKFKILGILTC